MVSSSANTGNESILTRNRKRIDKISRRKIIDYYKSVSLLFHSCSSFQSIKIMVIVFTNWNADGPQQQQKFNKRCCNPAEFDTTRRFETFTKNSLKNILFCYPPHTNKHTQIWRIVKLFNSNKTVQAICLTNYVV